MSKYLRSRLFTKREFVSVDHEWRATNHKTKESLIIENYGVSQRGNIPRKSISTETELLIFFGFILLTSCE